MHYYMHHSAQEDNFCKCKNHFINHRMYHQLEPGCHFVAVHTARLSTDGAEIWTNVAKHIAKKVMLSPMPLSLMTSLDCITDISR